MLLAMFSHFKTKREFSRFRRHLSDKLELEAKQYDVVRKEKEKVLKENENLRVQISSLNEKPDNKVSARSGGSGARRAAVDDQCPRIWRCLGDSQGTRR